MTIILLNFMHEFIKTLKNTAFFQYSCLTITARRHIDTPVLTVPMIVV
jgi:hypothetical protein